MSKTGYSPPSKAYAYRKPLLSTQAVAMKFDPVFLPPKAMTKEAVGNAVAVFIAAGAK